MTGRVDKRTTLQLAELVESVIKGQLDSTIRVAINMTDADPSLRFNRSFRKDAWDFIASFEHASIEDLDMPALLDQFFELLRRHHVRCPGDLVFLIKALTTIQGVGREIDPQFNVVGYIRPHVERLVRGRYGWSATRQRLMRAGRNYAEFIEDLPEDLRSLLTQFRRREFAFTLEHKGLDRLNDNIEHASRNIAMAMLCAGLIIASSIIVLAASGQVHAAVFSSLGLMGFLIAALMIGIFLFNMVFRRPRS
jgi:ubiquinone biosynthesis protein